MEAVEVSLWGWAMISEVNRKILTNAIYNLKEKNKDKNGNYTFGYNFGYFLALEILNHYSSCEFRKRTECANKLAQYLEGLIFNDQSQDPYSRVILHLNELSSEEEFENILIKINSMQNTITLSDSSVVSVSPELYLIQGISLFESYTLCRMIGGLNGHQEVGWHPNQKDGWYSFIPLDLCYNGVKQLHWSRVPSSIYIGAHKSTFRKFNTHPLNEKVRYDL